MKTAMVKSVLSWGEHRRTSDIAHICQCSRQWVATIRRRMRAIQDGTNIAHRIVVLDGQVQALRRSLLEYLHTERAPKDAPEKTHLLS